MEKELENSLIVQLDEKSKTASVIKSPKATGRVFIPHYAEIDNQKYKIISIKGKSFENNKIEILEFAEDSEVETFEKDCFYSAHLKKLQIPASLKILEGSWCNYIKDLTEIEVSPKNSLYSMYEGKFLLGKSESNGGEFDVLHYARFDIDDAAIPPQIKVVKEFSFYGHPNLKSITFSPESKLKTIKNFVIYSSPISHLVLPSSVEEIGRINFSSVSKLTKIEIYEGNNKFKVNEEGILLSKSDTTSSNFDELVFSPRNIEHVTIPHHIKVISNSAFYGCRQIKTITIEPNTSLEVISDYAFNSASSPSKIIIPETVKEIGCSSFYTIETLNSIEIRGKSVKIGTNCFSFCHNLSLISFPNATEIVIDSSAFFNISKDAKIEVNVEAKLSGDGYESCKSFISFIGSEKMTNKEDQEQGKETKPEETEKVEQPLTASQEIKEHVTGNNQIINDSPQKKQSASTTSLIEEELDDKDREILRLAKQIRYLEQRLSKYEKVKPTEISSKYEPKQTEPEKNKEEKDEENANKETKYDSIYIDKDKESEYETIEKISEGRRFICMKVVDKNTKERYCKKILKCETADMKDVQNAYKEFELLQSLNHPSICRAYYINTQEIYNESTTTTDELSTISVYLEYVDFKYEEVENKGILSNTLKTRIAVEVAQCMKYLHERGLIYRDLKLSSIMLNSVFEAKLIDMSQVHIGEGEFESYNDEDIYKTRRVGEEDFMSPEMKEGEDYDNKTDVYSFGIILYRVFTGQQPTQSMKDHLSGKNIELPIESPNINEHCIELIKRCLSNEPSRRPTFEEILEYIRMHNYKLASDVESGIVCKRDRELERI